ncbi:MAG: FecR domain-containing protein, partial [Planctomycetota bacterium]
AAAAACVTLISTLALVDIGGEIPRAVAGRVTSISDGAAFDGDPPVLGEILRDGAGIKIEDGFLTVTLGDGVKLDVVGPTKMTVENDGRVRLRAGLVAGRVGEAGRGFTVATEDADVVDLGTRFLVHKDQSVGTVVRVEEGRVEARLKDRAGSAVRVVDLVAGQTAKLNVYNETAEQTADVFDFRDRYEIVRQSKGEIERFSGSARPVIWSGYELAESDFLTGGSVYVIPERRQIVANSAVHSADIVRILDEDTLVDSYLFHFDFNEAGGHVYQTGRGSVTFGSDVVAIITDAAGLRETDGVYGLERGTFDTADHRGIETETDSVTVSDDGRTVA